MPETLPLTDRQENALLALTQAGFCAYPEQTGGNVVALQVPLPSGWQLSWLWDGAWYCGVTDPEGEWHATNGGGSEAVRPSRVVSRTASLARRYS